MSHHGSCHCGAVQFTVEGDFDHVLECNCSHCSRKGYLLWFAPRQALAIETGEAVLGTYLFNKHVIRHQFCTACGCAPFALGKKPDGSEMAAINVRCLEEVDLAAVKRVPIDGKSL